MKIYGNTDATDLVLFTGIPRLDANLLLGQYRELEAFCRYNDLSPYHIQVARKPEHLGQGTYFFVELGGEEVTAWRYSQPKVSVWGPWRPSRQARIYEPNDTRFDHLRTGPHPAWVYPLEDM